MRRQRAGLAVLVVGILAACERGPAPAQAPSDHPPMAAEEEERGLTLCALHVARVCGCAARDPGLAETCELARAMPSAVRMHLEVLHGAPLQGVGTDGKRTAGATTSGRRPPLNEEERRLTEGSLRKVIAGCVELDSRLDPATCPRPAPARREK